MEKKKKVWIIGMMIISAVLAGCTGENSSKPAEVEIPEGGGLVDVCTHSIIHSADLQPADDVGLVFLPENKDIVSMLVTHRRPEEQEQGVKLTQLAIYVTGLFEAEAGTLYMESTQITDYSGSELEAVMFELISVEGIKTKALITIRPETELMDDEVGNVIFQVMAQGPVDQWEKYKDSYEVFFESFHPKSCP